MRREVPASMGAHVLLSFLVCLALGSLDCLLVPAEENTGVSLPNHPPEVRITSGSGDFTDTDYRVHFEWAGIDEDGVVELFQWAIDDTLSENAWHDTTGFAASASVRASTPLENGSSQAADWHTFHVRAIDNDSGVSRPEQRYFNAVTIAPTSRITFPRLTGSHTELQRSFPVRWEGNDLDASDLHHLPAFYEFKLVNVPHFASMDTILAALRTQKNVLLDTLKIGDRRRWIRVPERVHQAEIRELRPSSGEIESYAFAVRAVDEAGAVEPVLQLARNCITFGVKSTISAPSVTVTEEHLGSHTFPSDGDVWENLTLFTGRPYRFRWSGDAGTYGSEAGNANYALDIADPGDDSLQDARGIGGWIGWGRWEGIQVPFVFTPDQAGVEHVLYLRMRDISDEEESTRYCEIRMNVVDFTFSRFALLVDDAVLNEGVHDAPHDAFLKESLLSQLYRYGPVDDWSAFGDNDWSNFSEPLPDDLLVRYQHIVWNLNFSGGREPSLYSTENRGNGSISAFLAAGGRLFIFGGPIRGALIKRTNIYPCYPPRSTEPEELDRLPYKFLYMRNTIYSSYFQGPDQCAAETGGLYIAHSRNPAFPDLFLDRRKWDAEQRDPLEPTKFRGGIRVWEGLKLAPFRDAPVSLEGLDTLYVAQTWNRSGRDACYGAVGPGNGAVCAWRYESTRADTLAHRQHGRVIIFDFQPYYFQRERLTDAGTAAVDWLVRGRTP